MLDALGEACSKLRGELGESLATVQKFDVPLAEATTSSLEALKAYSLGEKAFSQSGQTAALPYHQRAIELDPSFATAYQRLGDDYFGLGQVERAREYFRKAYELREHASDRERLAIIADYFLGVTGELDKATQPYQEVIQIYPRDYRTRQNLGNLYAAQGHYERAREMFSQSLDLARDNVAPYVNLLNALLALQRFDEVRQTIRQVQVLKLDNSVLHNAVYAFDFLTANSGGMAQEQQWFIDRPEENIGISLASDTEAYGGHLRRARERTEESVNLRSAPTVRKQARYGRRLPPSGKPLSGTATMLSSKRLRGCDLLQKPRR